MYKNIGLHGTVRQNDFVIMTKGHQTLEQHLKYTSDRRGEVFYIDLEAKMGGCTNPKMDKYRIIHVLCLYFTYFDEMRKM